MSILDEAQKLMEELVSWRRRIHRQPELGFDVYQTAELVSRTLSDLGVEAQSGVGRTGVVAYLGDGEGPTIAIRADIVSQNARYAYTAAFFLNQQGRAGEAMVILRGSVDRGIAGADSVMLLLDLYRRMGMREEAEQLRQQALRRLALPDNVRAWLQQQ